MCDHPCSVHSSPARAGRAQAAHLTKVILETGQLAPQAPNLTLPPTRERQGRGEGCREKGVRRSGVTRTAPV